MTIETIIGLISVAFLWGITNPFMKKGAQGIESIESPSAINQICSDTFFLWTNLKYMIPFIINQCGSVIYILVLQKVDLSLTVVVVNSLTFVITALTGAYLGEEKIRTNTFIGIMLVLLGTAICCIDKTANDET